MAVTLDPDPRSTWGASQEYIDAWRAAYGTQSVSAKTTKPDWSLARRNPLARSVDASAATLSVSTTADSSFTRVYTASASPTETSWPFLRGRGTSGIYSTLEIQADPTFYMARPFDTITDGDALQILTYSYAGEELRFFIDDRPLTDAPTIAATTGFQYFVLAFPNARRRHVRLHTGTGILQVMTKGRYQCFRPEPFQTPLALVVGDSYAAPAVMDNVTGALNSSGMLTGLYQDIARDLGLDEIMVDGVGGSGYSVGTRSYLQALETSVAKYRPDLLIAHGGGGNDIYQGKTDAQIISAATNFFARARMLCGPHAKLVFIEGVSPPGFTPATYNPRYIAIRQALQAALSAVGVYYIDVATTDPWIKGAGNVAAPVADGGNSSIYIGSDGLHYTANGAAYLRGRMAPKLQSVIADDGTLLNTLI